MADHDRGYKILFAQPKLVEDLLRGFVQEPWVEQLDFSTLKRVSGTYISEDLREREDDMVWRVGWGEKTLYVYLLLEFQSRPERFMALRMLAYVALLLQDLLRRGETTSEGLLPPILPLLLYNGRERWTAPVELGRLIAHVPGLERYQPALRYLLIDEGRYSAVELESLRNLSAAVFRLEQSRSPEDVKRVVRALSVWLAEPALGDVRRTFLTWIRNVLLPARLPGAELPEADDLREFEAMLEETVIDWTRDWKQQGIEEGRKEGRQQGRQEGRKEGRKQGRKEGEILLFLRQLEHKFGPVAEDLRKRVRGAASDQILLWGERLLDAEDLDEVFS